MNPVRLHYEILGGGHPVIILHGLFGAGRNWHGIAKKMAVRHRVILVDLRNHGKSSHAATMGYTEMAADMQSSCAKTRWRHRP